MLEELKNWKSIWLMYISSCMTAVMMRPGLITFAVIFINAFILIVMRRLALAEGRAEANPAPVPVTYKPENLNGPY